MSIGDPGWGAATFAVGAMVGGPPGLTMVGGIAGLTKRSDVRLLDGATICPPEGGDELAKGEAVDWPQA